MIRVLYISNDELFKKVIELAFYNYDAGVELVKDENGLKAKLQESDLVLIDCEFFPSIEQFVNICKSADKPVILLQNVFEADEKSVKTDGVILLQKPFDDLLFIKEVKKCCNLKLKTGENKMADTTKEKDNVTMNDEEEILELTDIIEEAADDVSDILANKEELESVDDLSSSSFEEALKEESKAKEAMPQEEESSDIFENEGKSEDDIFSFESKDEVEDDEPLLELKDGKLTSSKETVNNESPVDAPAKASESEEILELDDEAEQILEEDVSDKLESEESLEEALKDPEEIFSEKEENIDSNDAVLNGEELTDELETSEVAYDMSEQKDDVASQEEMPLPADTESLGKLVSDDKLSTEPEELQGMENVAEIEEDTLSVSKDEQIEVGEEIHKTDELPIEEITDAGISDKDIEEENFFDSVSSDEENDLSEPELEISEETDDNVEQNEEMLIEDESATESEGAEDIRIPIDEETRQLANEIDNGKEDDDFVDMEAFDDLKSDFSQEHVKENRNFVGQDRSSIDLSMVEIKLIEASGKILEAIEEATVEIAKGIAKVTPKIIEEVSKEIIPKIAQKIISEELNNINKKDKDD